MRRQPLALRIMFCKTSAAVADKIPADIAAASNCLVVRPKSRDATTQYTGRPRWWDLRPDSTA
ncbi:MAG: hypothetical protein E6K53_02715 [Gammaproteobacteria bacterium]|nr:MAG: hypothetical protein E6K53_02715 [Gammaproteobacteria bacterium]